MTRPHKNLVVFDWNGTILADLSANLRAMNAVLKTLDVAPVTRDAYQRHYTMPLDKLYHAVGVDPGVLLEKEHEIHPLFHSEYGKANVRLRRGAKKMLQAVRATSSKSIILSNTMIASIERQAAHFGIREHFDDILAFHRGDATFRRQAKGDRLKEYLKAKPVRRAIILGDTEEEIEIGRALGLATIAITDGMCSTPRLRAMKPDFMVRTLEQVPEIVQRVFGAKGAK